MRLVTQLPDFFRAGVFFQLAIFIAISLTRRYVISSSSIRVTLLVMLLISTFISPGQTVDQDLSFIESFLRILTSLSAFVISESPSIVILILTDKSVISIIQPRIERVFLVYRTPTSSLVTSNYPNWSELPTDTIGEILNRLPNVPLLNLSETLDDSNTRRRFFNLCDSRRYQLELSRIRGKRCWGSPHGLVIALGPDYDIHIENLDQRIEPIALPPLDTIRRELAGREEWFRLVHKFIIFKEPAESDRGLSFLVFAIFGPKNRLAFARPGRDGWTIFTNRNNLEFKDVARFKDQLYGLCDNGTLVRFELDAPDELELIASQPQDVGEPQKLYLVKSLENLYGVFRYGFYIPSENRHVTIYFLIYKFNFSALHWEEVTNLEDHAVFVGDGNSWCFPTSSFNIRSKTIYFTDDNWDSQMLPGVAYGGCDVGLFDMEMRVIQRLPFSMDTRHFYSRSIWVTANLLLRFLTI